jgi:hypothetical protein
MGKRNEYVAMISKSVLAHETMQRIEPLPF